MMPIVSFANEVITRLRAPLVKDHGSMVPDWALAVPATLTGWTLQPGASAEDLQNREAVRVDWTAYGPYDADVIASDRIRLPSGDYSVIGEPERWKSPTGRVSSTKMLLQRWSDRG
jgi:hypothetical protein